MNEKLISEIFSEKREVPYELKDRIHKELLKLEKKIMIRNIAVSLTAVFVLSFFAVSFAVVFVGNILSLIIVACFSIASVFMATALAVIAGKYEIRNIKKGLL